MKPQPTVLIQSGLGLVTTVLAVALAGPNAGLAAIIANGLGLALVGGLAARYHHRVSERTRSDHRAARDRTMLAVIAVGLLGSLAVGVLAATAGVPWDPPFASVPGDIAADAAIGIFASMITSSCVDWYLIRPFRDGVLGPPACQMHAHDEETALFYARAWVAHRAVAEVFGWGGLAVVLIVLLVAVQKSTDDATWADVLTYLAPSGAVYLGIGGHLARRLRPVPRYLQRPSPGLGRWATGTVENACGNERTADGFVIDVAIGEGVRLRSRRGATESVALDQAGQLADRRVVLCERRCQRLIPQCERGLLEEQADEKGSPKTDVDR